MAELPEMIGKYKIVSLVAKGGMGAVYKAIHPSLRRYVILKKLTIRGNAAIIERFKREARILLDFKHSNIVHFFDYFKEGNSHYIVLEYIDGMSLDGLIKKRRFLSSPLALLIFLDACKALKYAHDNGVIHRDIKPANILISKKGTVKLADFGIAASENESDDGLTKEGMTLGTPSYMPPEQFENTRNVDKRADIYAMGIMLYEMVSGKRPYPGNFAADTILMIQKGKHLPVRRLNPDVSPLVARLIKKMIRPKPTKRYQDLAPVIRTIERQLQRYDTAAIKATLTDCINTDLKDEPQFKARTRKRHIIVPALLAALALAMGLYQAQKTAYLHQWFMPAAYGPVSIRVRIPKTLKESRDVFLAARLFLNDGEEIPELQKPAITFTLAPGDEADPYYSFVSGRLVLKPGEYRLKLLSEQRLIWESFEVLSWSQLKKDDLANPVLEYRFDNIQNRPLTVRAEATNAKTGQAISQPIQLLVLYNNRWRPLAEMSPENLRTGRVWRFRVEAAGYQSETFSLLVGNYQDELILRAALQPADHTAGTNK